MVGTEGAARGMAEFLRGVGSFCPRTTRLFWWQVPRLQLAEAAWCGVG